MNKLIQERALEIGNPLPLKGSYSESECLFLMTEVKDTSSLEIDNMTKEVAIQSGVHYSEMLPKESLPTKEYLSTYRAMLESSKKDMAQYIANVSKRIIQKKGSPILVSLARAGTPIGVLIHHYLKDVYNITLPHYTISILRGKGIDENALIYIINKYGTDNIQFIDGWTGKGAINKELHSSCEKFNQKYNVNVDSNLAVLADPSYSTTIYGTREDVVIPSACLNSTVSGLVSRTFNHPSYIKPHQFHGCRIYREWEGVDESLSFIDEVRGCFEDVEESHLPPLEPTTHIGLLHTKKICEEYDISDINLCKPGVNEATRILLRRVPYRILVRDKNHPHLQHLLLLANEKGVLVEEKNDMIYLCCGLIKDLKE